MINRYLITAGVLFFIMLFPAFKCKAPHIFAADISFECLGNNVYQVDLIVYLNCNETPNLANRIEWIGLDNNCSGQKYLNILDETDVTNVCHTQCTGCGEGACNYIYGLNARRFQGILDFSSSPCNEFHFWWSFPQQNQNLDNISLNYFDRMEVYLNTDLSECPSTPKYHYNPLMPAICKDEHTFYSHNVTVPEGDSIIFNLDVPLTNYYLDTFGDPVQYLPGYSAVSPLDYMGSKFPNGHRLPFPYGFHLDKMSGDLKFVPNAEMEAVMQITAHQYRGDTLISRTPRLMQVRIIDCPGNNPPVINLNTNHSVCDGSTLTYKVNIADPDSSLPDPDSVFIFWNEPFHLSEASFTPDSGIVYASGIFEWTPQPTDTGTFYVDFIGRDNGCIIPLQTVQIDTINVRPTPRAILQIDTLGCGQVSFSADLTHKHTDSVIWQGSGGLDFRGSSVVHTYSQPGVYPYSVTLYLDDCQSKYYDTVVVPEFETISIDAGNDIAICKNEPFTISPSVQTASGQAEIHWSTGDSNSASMTYSFDKDTTIIVTAVNQAGCIATDKVDVHVFGHSGLPSNKTHICIGQAEVISSGLPQAYDHKWIFVDGGNTLLSTDNFVTVSSPGTYTVEITGTSSMQCTTIDTFYVSDSHSPEASFIFEHECENKPVSFMSTSTVPSGDIIDYTWDFGDGNTSSSLGTTHQYNTYGTYPVSLTVTTDSLCTSTITHLIEIYEVPQADFQMPLVCSGVTTHFNNLTNYSPGAEMATYEWTFGLSVPTSSEFEPEYVFPETGQYPVTLKATSPEGCTTSKLKVVEVHDQPSASFETADACVESEITLNNLSDGNNLTSHWDFGDGNDAAGHSPKYAYANPGKYEILLTVSNAEGCSDENATEINIFELPEAGFTYTQSGGKYSFTPEATGHATYNWTFGDESNSTSVTPEHEFPENGTYEVRLLVEDDRGCINEESMSITVTNTTLSPVASATGLNLSIRPNPYTEATHITYTLHRNTEVNIVLYDLTGRALTVVESGYKGAGTHTSVLNANESGISSGVYMIKVQAGDALVVERIVQME